MGMFYFEDQCHVLWLLKTCKTCGWPLFLKLFLQLKQVSECFSIIFMHDWTILSLNPVTTNN
jgi:hypothetical protein